MKVNYSEKNTNEPFLKQYPKIPAYPHFFVLDRNGQFLHAQGTAELEEGRGYDEKVFLDFLTKWKPGGKPALKKAKTVAAIDAEDVLKDGLLKARAEKKKVLIHLGAPS